MKDVHDNREHPGSSRPDEPDKPSVFGNIKGDFFSSIENPFRSEPPPAPSGSDAPFPPATTQPPEENATAASPTAEQAPVQTHVETPVPPVEAPAPSVQNKVTKQQQMLRDRLTTSGQNSADTPLHGQFIDKNGGLRLGSKQAKIFVAVALVTILLVILFTKACNTPAAVASTSPTASSSSLAAASSSVVSDLQPPATQIVTEPQPFEVSTFTAGGNIDTSVIQDYISYEDKDGNYWLAFSSGAVVKLIKWDKVSKETLSADRKTLVALINEHYLYQFMPDGTFTLIAKHVSDFALSPTGDYLFYHQMEGESSVVYRKHLKGAVPDYSISVISLDAVAFSPNGEQILYVDNGKLFTWSAAAGTSELSVDTAENCLPLGISDDGEYVYFRTMVFKSGVLWVANSDKRDFTLHIVAMDDMSTTTVFLGRNEYTTYSNMTGDELFITGESTTFCFQRGLLSQTNVRSDALPNQGRFAALYTYTKDAESFVITQAPHFNTLFFYGFFTSSPSISATAWAWQPGIIDNAVELDNYAPNDFYSKFYVAEDGMSAIMLTKHSTLERYTFLTADDESIDLIDTNIIADNVGEFACSADTRTVYYLALPEELHIAKEENKNRFQLYRSAPDGLQLLAEKSRRADSKMTPYLVASPDGNSCMVRYITDAGQQTYLYRENTKPSMHHISDRYSRILNDFLPNNHVFWYANPYMAQEGDVVSLFLFDGQESHFIIEDV